MYPTLEHVAMESRPYPTHLLQDCESGLALFAAAFMGHNDAIHFAEARMRCVCCDTDAKKLLEMSKLYPDDWTFVPEDAWTFADRVSSLGMTWDAVSVDTFTGEAMDKSLKSLELWCSLARKVVTVTLTLGASYLLPRGWVDSKFERASGVYWLVLERR